MHSLMGQFCTKCGGDISMRLRAEGTLAKHAVALRSLDALRNLEICLEKASVAMILLTMRQIHSFTLPFYACTLSLL